MKSRAQLWIAFFSAMAVALVAVSETGRSSPGALATVHQREPDLAGRNDCSACHGGLFGDMREACLECHEPVAAQLADETGLHGGLGARAEQCGLCHAEHHGAGAPLVHGQSFALAGAGKREEFDHALVGWVMDGAHAPLECKACHEHADDVVLAAGARRFLGLDQDCATCHEDAHHGQRALACASCHGQATWEDLASAEHEPPLIGGHGGLACTECHAAGGPHALDVLGGQGRQPAARECADCHESPHAEGFVEGVAALGDGLAPGASCVVCHAAEHETFHELALLGMTAAQHAASGFPLAAPHDGLECTACHAPEKNRFGGRYPGRGPEQCSACHEDVHEGQFEGGPFGGQECTACHEAARWEPHAFTAKEHALGALELTGTHLELACEECHEQPAPEAARVFHGTPSRCEACHADAHEGFFAASVPETSAPHGACERCHDATSFAAAAAAFDHERFADFPVRGAHEQGGCAACHEAAAAPDEAGRTFGRVAALFGRFEGCGTCHEDPHGGRFDAAELPAEVAGARDCARCHAESSFRALARPFDHGAWTGFALAGAHSAAACAACHEPIPGASGAQRSSAEAPGARCADCHEDPHGGQFVEGGATDCARCHDPARADLLSFDHERDSRFALGDAHADLACAACHATEARGGLAVVRFKPLASECRDCHGDSTEVLLRRRPRKR